MRHNADMDTRPRQTDGQTNSQTVFHNCCKELLMSAHFESDRTCPSLQLMIGPLPQTSEKNILPARQQHSRRQHRAPKHQGLGLSFSWAAAYNWCEIGVPGRETATATRCRVHVIRRDSVQQHLEVLPVAAHLSVQTSAKRCPKSQRNRVKALWQQMFYATATVLIRIIASQSQ